MGRKCYTVENVPRSTVFQRVREGQYHIGSLCIIAGSMQLPKPCYWTIVSASLYFMVNVGINGSEVLYLIL